ncbi:MAG: hypothetical protein FWE83_02815 [Oscillospiraceae bacterium]|jgi:hypothetical protein|nr:hypothetical protein [Oscillospiraceae bacterium]
MENQTTFNQGVNPLQDTHYTMQYKPPATRKAPIVSIIICCIGILVGVVIALHGIIISVDFAENKTSNVSGNFTSRLNDEYETVRRVAFGADFYTEIHAATAAAANNIYYLGNDLAVVSNNISRIGNDLSVVANNTNSIGNNLTNVGEAILALRVVPIAIGLFISLFFALKMCVLIENRSANIVTQG